MEVRPRAGSFHDDNTRDSMSGPESETSSSLVSGLSLLENDTTNNTDADFYKRAVAEARQRDQRRLQDAISGERVQAQAFRKARPRPGSVEGLLNGLKRSTSLKEPATASQELDGMGRASPRHSLDSDRSSSPNLPPQWGRKGRQSNDFLKRLGTKGQDTEPGKDEMPKKQGEKSGSESDTIYRRKTAFTGDSPRSDINWDDGALPSVEDSPSRKRFPRASPTFSRRQSELDRMMAQDRRQEDDSARPKTSQGVFGRTRPLSDHFRSSSHSIKADVEDIAEPISNRGGAFGLRRSKTTGGTSSARVAGSAAEEQTSMDKREGSGVLLRQLARAASATPSPSLRDESDTPTRGEGDAHSKTKEALNQETPDLAGSWIETPALNARKSLPQSKTSNHPKSAAEAALLEARRETTGDEAEDGRAVGNTMIASLRALLDDADEEELSMLLEDDEDTMDLIRNVTTPVSDSAKKRKAEYLALYRMNRRLRQARLELRDANEDLEPPKTMKQALPNGALNHMGEHTSQVCEACGCGAAHSIQQITLGSLCKQAWEWYRTFFYSWTSSGRLRFTWIGLLVVLFWAWCFSEAFLCELYCLPVFQYMGDRRRSSWEAPGRKGEYLLTPWVTATMFYRWFIVPVDGVLNGTLYVREREKYYYYGRYGERQYY